MNLLFVCTGNTCRSPMAEVCCHRLCRERKIDFIRAASAGTGAFAGQGASDGARRAVSEAGLSLEDFSSSRLDRELAERTDLAVCMSESHAARVRELAPGCRVRLLAPGGISDPFGGSDEEYRRCFREIEAAVAALLDELTVNHK